MNGVPLTDAEEVIYHFLIVDIASSIINSCNDLRLRLRRSKNKIYLVKKIVRENLDISIDERAAGEIFKILEANLRKDTSRKQITLDKKNEILLSQDGRCGSCSQKIINSQLAHLDHIIPFSLVGDELENNFQILCQTCNLRKGSSLYFNIAMLLYAKRET